MYSNDEYAKAKKRVKAKKSFYQHLMSYAIVNLFLFALNLLTSPSHYWFIYPMLGWGIGLAFHYVDVFGIPGFDILSKEWEDRELERELDKERQRNEPLKKSQPMPQPKERPMELKEIQRNYDETDFV